jgi:ribosomal-protein-alanine N-acetyltransferase
MRALLAEHPAEPGYACWYIVADERLVGVIGFKGPPTAQGEVEIGYAIVETEQRKGYGVAAAELMVAKAFADPRVKRVVAQTLPRLEASQKVLTRCGFVHVGGHLDAEEGQIMRFERARA